MGKGGKLPTVCPYSASSFLHTCGLASIRIFLSLSCLHMPVSPPNFKFQAFSPYLTHLHRRRGEKSFAAFYYFICTFFLSAYVRHFFLDLSWAFLSSNNYILDFICENCRGNTCAHISNRPNMFLLSTHCLLSLIPSKIYIVEGEGTTFPLNYPGCETLQYIFTYLVFSQNKNQNTLNNLKCN